MRKVVLILLFIVSPLSAQVQPFNWFNKPTNNIPAYSAEATQYFNRMTVKPASDTLAIYAEFIDSLVLNGVWNILDDFKIFANSDTLNALTNLKDNRFNAIGHTPITFTPYQGYLSGALGYICSTFNPADSLTHNFRLYSNSFGVYSRTQSVSSNCGDIVTGTKNGTSADSLVYLSIGWAATIGVIHDCSSFTTPDNGGSTIGFYQMNRLGATLTYTGNTTTHYSGTLAVTKLPNSTLEVSYGAGGVVTSRQIALYYIGGGMTAQQMKDFNSCVQRLKTKIGF